RSLQPDVLLGEELRDADDGARLEAALQPAERSLVREVGARLLGHRARARPRLACADEARRSDRPLVPELTDSRDAARWLPGRSNKPFALLRRRRHRHRDLLGARAGLPRAAGAGSELLARLLADGLAKRLGQPFVVVNRPGANTNLGTFSVVRAKAD